MSDQPYPYVPDNQGNPPTTPGLIPPETQIRDGHMRDVVDGVPRGMSRVDQERGFNLRWKFMPGAASRLRSASRASLGRLIR